MANRWLTGVGLLIVLLVFLPSAAAAVPTVVRGSLYPDGPLRAMGRVFVPVSQPAVTSWSMDDERGDPFFKSPNARVIEDEWRWTSLAEQRGTNPGPGAVHVRATHDLLNATLNVVHAGEDNRFFYAGLEGGARILVGDLQDCTFYPAAPEPRFVRTGTTDAPGKVLAPLVRVLIDHATTLHLDCRSTTLSIGLHRQNSSITVFDAVVRAVGVDPIAKAPRESQFISGHFTYPNQTATRMVDHVLRQVTVLPQAPGARVEASGSRRVSIEAPVLQVNGSLEIPPYVGDFPVGDEEDQLHGKATRIEGIFLAVAGGRTDLRHGLVIAGSENAPFSAAASSGAGFPATMTFTVALAALAFLALLWKLKAHIGGILLGFTRLTPIEVLQQKRRRLIYDYVLANPGIRTHTACKALDENRTTFRHHVKVLAQHGLLAVVADGRRRYLFPARVVSGRRGLALQREPFVQQLLDLLAGGAIVSQVSLAAELGVSQAYVSRILVRLEGEGMIERQRRAHGTRYLLRSATVAPDRAPDAETSA